MGGGNGGFLGRAAAALLVLAAALPEGAVAQSAPAAAEAQRQVAGRVGVVGGAVDPATLAVRLNDAALHVDAAGTITGAAPQADRYRLRIEGAGIFATIHDFAPGEIAGPDGGITLPLVEAVARAPGRVELFFGGDAMIGRRFETPIWDEPVRVRPETRSADMAALLAPIAPYFAQSDLASVNLETVLATATPGDSPGKSVVFFTHSDAAAALAGAGIDYVSLGNNHVYDYLEPGLATTVAALDAAGIRWSGAGANAAEALRAARIDVGGNAYSMLGYVGWQGRVEPNQVAEADKGGAAFGTDSDIAESVRREVAAGRIPIVQYHGSTEYSDTPTDISERRMKLAIEAGAALVVSHHPHVAQGLELHRGRLIAYSLGNFLFDQYFPETHASIALKVWMDSDRLFRAEVVPLQILDYRPVPAVGAIRQGVLRRVGALSAARATPLALVAGHGVIRPDGGTAASGCPVAYGGAIAENRLPVAGPAAPCGALPAKRGRDLLMRGDFEAVHFGDAVDRSWAVSGAAWRYAPGGRGGGTAMDLAIENGEATVTPKSFFRPADTHAYSLAGWIRSDTAARLEALVQVQPAGDGRLEALESAPWRAFGSTEVAAGEWQFFRFDVETDGDRPLRPMLRLTGAGHASLDDLTFIAWEGAGATGEWSHGE